MEVTKMNGEREPFDKEKFLSSLAKAGFSELEIDRALSHIEYSLYDGMTTDEIYDKALDALKKGENIEPVIKYSLKRAILELGPTGFPFEQLIARLYKEKGYEVQTGVMLQGNCVDHETDIIAYKDDELIVIEAKFHNDQHVKSDTKVALYVKARYDDLLGLDFKIENKIRKITQAILITNTGFTDNSRKYAKCVGTFDMISWSYPKNAGLLRMIEDAKIHPITAIPTLSKKEKMDLIGLGCIYCKDLLLNPDFLKEADVRSSKIDTILETVKLICKEND